MAIGFANPKVKVHTLNGMDFLMQQKESFDIIITDSSDPVGMFMDHMITESTW